jgi:hypothetical protein
MEWGPLLSPSPSHRIHLVLLLSRLLSHHRSLSLSITSITIFAYVASLTHSSMYLITNLVSFGSNTLKQENLHSCNDRNICCGASWETGASCEATKSCWVLRWGLVTLIRSLKSSSPLSFYLWEGRGSWRFSFITVYTYNINLPWKSVGYRVWRASKPESLCSC